ncbi:protein PLASTID MOVEMENT IMPAIRED 2-like [Miscanthus floridulus]|uniref:protein PLASTID MOVEMENT IMPAIRED 2-like n=1 Tax=Miscanthus floridulus TaxID=154761 RepID=UPI00345AC905
MQAKRTLANVLRRDRSLGASDPDDRFATASSSDVELESADTAVVPTTDRLAEQEERASAQVQQLNDRLLRARTQLDAAMAADERAEAVLAELSAALRQLGKETEAAEKERALTELENQCVREDEDTIGAEIGAVKQRVRESVKELEATRASEAMATAKLRAAVEAATLARAAVISQQMSGNMTISRFEYEYLIGRPC